MERESKTARKMVQVKDRGGGGSHVISRAAKTGLSLLRNQTETLATQAKLEKRFFFSLSTELVKWIGHRSGIEKHSF